MPQEIWKPIAGHEGSYEVSDAGRVRSLPRRDSIGRPLPGTVLKSTEDQDGYRRVTIYHDGKPRYCRVHHLVLIAFVGPRPEGLEACHDDGDPSNNTAGKLRWDSHSMNTRDKVRHGTHPSAAKTHCPRGHELSSRNLAAWPLKVGKRACLACKRAKDYIRANGGELQEISDRYFATIKASVDE